MPRNYELFFRNMLNGQRVLMKKESLREGYTTGTAATAAAMAATRLLLGRENFSFVRVPLPPFAVFDDGAAVQCEESAQTPMRPFGPHSEGCMRFWDIVPAFCKKLGRPGMAMAGVIKDGGDDPDATNGLMIEALVILMPDWGKGEIVVKGGRGVGVATLPGLPIPVGSAAINPAPMAQIRRGIAMELAAGKWPGGVLTRIIVPGGEARARHTLNPRLGILGGISILGTQGVVRPYSHDAWQATILQGLRVARSLGFDMTALSTGRRTERLQMATFPAWPAQCFIQVADHMRFSVEAAVGLGFRRIAAGFFFGKLVKLAQGVGHTHAHAAPLCMTALGNMLAVLGLEPHLAAEARTANTALHVLRIMERSAKYTHILDALCRMALKHVAAWAAAASEPCKATGVHVTIRLFSPEERLLAQADSMEQGGL